MNMIVRRSTEGKDHNSGSKCWVFQYRKDDDISAIRRGDTYRWQASGRIGKGDKVVLWKSGDDAGVFGFGKVVSDPIKRPFFGKPLSLRFQVTDRLDEILLRAVLHKSAILRKLSVVAGTSYGVGITSASPAQFECLIKLGREAGPKNYWVFQANPRTGDNLPKLLASDSKSGCWRLTRFKDPRQHFRSGDKIVLWQAEGNKPELAGVYAIGEITKPPIRIHGVWQGWYRLTMIRDLDNPISARLLRSDRILGKIPVFGKRAAQGSNFRISREQWEAIAAHFTRRTNGDDRSATFEPTRQNGQIPNVVLVSGTEPHEIELAERHLVRAYQKYMGGNGSHPCSYRIRPASENTIECDLYDKRRGNLIEAKSVVCRESVRMAIGQLADYVRFIRPRPKLAVLLPYQPSAELERLLKCQNIDTIWQTEDGRFSDNSAGRQFT